MFKLIIWRKGKPKVAGTYLLKLADGDYTTSPYIPGGQWLCLREVKQWAKL